MLLDLDIRDRRVVIFGERGDAASAARRFARAGARVRLVAADQAATDESRTGVHRLCQPDVGDTPALLRLLAPAWLVVTAGPPSELVTRVRLLCSQLKIVHTHQSPGSARTARSRRAGRRWSGHHPTAHPGGRARRCSTPTSSSTIGWRPPMIWRGSRRGQSWSTSASSRTTTPTSQARIEELMIERARRAVRGPAQGRRSVRVRPGRRGDAGLPCRRGGRPGRAGRLQRRRRPGRGRHPGDAPRHQPRLHGHLRARAAVDRGSWRRWSGWAAPS